MVTLPETAERLGLDFVELTSRSEREAADRRGSGGGAVAQLVGGRSEQVAERYRLASPIERLPLGVPQLLVHGARDRHVPTDMSERYAEAARAAGDPVDLAVGHDVATWT